MTNWKYTDPSNRVAARTLEDGITESCLAEVLPPDTVIEPADPVPNPRIAEIQSELTLIDQKSIRAIREGDSARIAQWEAQAQALRVELASL